jgi:DNA-directed RNA polymerase beta subunit
MIRWETFRLQTQLVDGIRFVLSKPEQYERPFCLVYFSENSTLVEDYPKLNLSLIDFKVVIVPYVIFPKSRLSRDIKNQYKGFGLSAYQSNMKIPERRSVIIDLAQYMKSVDNYLMPINYRVRAGRFISNILRSTFNTYSSRYNVIFMYTVDIAKKVDKIIDRKAFPILRDIKDGDFPFDNFILGTVSGSKARYRLLMKNGEFTYPFIFQYVKTISQHHQQETEDQGITAVPHVDDEEEPEISSASNDVMKDIEPHVNKSNLAKFRTSISSFFKKDEKSLDKVVSKDATADDKKKIAIASVLYKSTGDLPVAQGIAKYIPSADIVKALATVDKKYADEVIPREPAFSTSEDPAVKLSNVPQIIDRKTPAHIITKRQMDFSDNLRKDIGSAFGTLKQKKDVPLSVKKIQVVDKPTRGGEIEKTDVSLLKVDLQDHFGSIHKLVIEIPKIDKFGTFSLNGRRMCLLNQIIFCPITFPEPYDSRFESSYSQFHVYSVRTREPYRLEVYMGSSRIGLLIFLAFAFGFEKTLKDYGVTYTIVDKRPKEEFSSRISEDKYIVFGNVDSELKKELCQSFIKEKVFKYGITKEFGTYEYFSDLIYKITGRINSTYLITVNVENIVNPITKQILLNKNQPTELSEIIKYMATKVISGYSEEINDLSSRRIRNSEVLVHLLQKMIEASYSTYRGQVLSGNKKAKFEIEPGKLMYDFERLEIVVDLEYANPVEELAILTRVSPMGKSISGISGREAVQVGSRNTHDSYFGNIDPLDTPENDGVGVIQYLTVDASITTARGLFFKKALNDKERSGILSTTSSMIPFIERNDGARVLMAVGHARQALPLKNPQAPIVQSGYESILSSSLSDNFVKFAPCDGVVESVSRDHIIISCKGAPKVDVDITPRHLRSGSGTNTLSVFIPKVRKGDTVKKSQMVAEGACISNGMIALGRTLCVALMNYKGYNFEDSIVINESLVEQDKLTSLHGETIEVLVSEKDRVLFINSIGKRTEKGEPLLRKTKGEIEEVLGYSEDTEDDSVYTTGREFIKKSPGGVIVDIEVFTNMNIDKFPSLKNLFERTSRKYKRTPGASFTVKGTTIKGILIRFRIEQERKISVSDKLANRYGNKGVISLLEKNEYMPRTPWGEKIDLILNPIGVLKRMNVGQLFEMYCGLISRALASKIVATSDRGKIIDGLKKVLTLLDSTQNKIYSTTLVENIARLGSASFSKFIASIKQTGFFPIIIPPFQSPKIDKIKECLRILGLQDAYYLDLPEFGTKTQQPVPVGYMYIYKLEHMGELKIYGRSTGIVSGKVMQPVAGKRLEGGQKVGENDTYSLVSYNCPTLLSEFFGPLSDDHATKNEIISDIIHIGSAPYREAKTSPIRDLVTAYVTGMMLTNI